MTARLGTRRFVDDLLRCVDDHQMPGIRLHPGYHGYRLDDPLAAELFDLAAQRRMIVQVVIRMDDVRVQHPLMQLPDGDARPLADLVAAKPGLHVLVLNALATVRGNDLRRLAAERRIGFEIAMREMPDAENVGTTHLPGPVTGHGRPAGQAHQPCDWL